MTNKTDQVELESALQQRADYIPIENLLSETSQQGDLFKKVTQELTNRGLRTIVGPRGCGKTHMMRFAWLKCRDDRSMPFAVYVSFNR
jgi:predicted AAA+ superfamily ATPase